MAKKLLFGLFGVRWRFICLLLSFIPSIGLATERLTIHAHHVPIQEAIALFAEVLHLNAIQSPTINGTMSLDFVDADPEKAFDWLLNTQALAKAMDGNNCYIAPVQELLRQAEINTKIKQQFVMQLAIKTAFIPLHYARAAYVGHLLQPGQTKLLSARGSIQVDTPHNALIIIDVPDKIYSIKQLIKRLDRPVQQVVLEARIVSVDNDCEQALGLRLPIYSGQASARLSAQDGNYALTLGRLADNTLLDVKLAALERKGQAKLISSPTLSTSNLETALIESGEEIPYQEVSESGGTAVTFKKAVLGLEVTPEILADSSKVLLKLQINQDRPSHKLIQGVPTINTRKILTHILIGDGKTVVLGGIYEAALEDGEASIPFINQIPLLGRLLSDRNTRTSKRELLIFVTPRIVKQKQT